MSTTVRAELIAGDTAVTLGITANSHTPVLSLCRKLAEAGHDPATPLHAYRGDTLCLTIRSIGDGAGLTVAEHQGTRFAPWKPFLPFGGSPRIAPNRPRRVS
jgi:hypothetical protein